MRDDYIVTFRGKEIAEMTLPELIQVLCYEHLDKEYDVDTLTREEALAIIKNYYDSPRFRNL